jgi:hypothetical protein
MLVVVVVIVVGLLLIGGGVGGLCRVAAMGDRDTARALREDRGQRRA